MSKRSLFLLSVGCFLTMLTGCGQKGPLYLPKVPPPLATPTAPAKPSAPVATPTPEASATATAASSGQSQ